MIVWSTKWNRSNLIVPSDSQRDGDNHVKQLLLASYSIISIKQGSSLGVPTEILMITHNYLYPNFISLAKQMTTEKFPTAIILVTLIRKLMAFIIYNQFNFNQMTSSSGVTLKTLTDHKSKWDVTATENKLYCSLRMIYDKLCLHLLYHSGAEHLA